MSDSSRVDELAVRLVEAELAAVLHHADADAIGLLRDRIPQRNVRDVDRRIAADDAALLVLHRVGPLVLLHLVHAGDDHVLGPDDAGHLAALALVAAGDYDDVVAFPDLAHRFPPYSTSGASDTIFMNRSVRSSR